MMNQTIAELLANLRSLTLSTMARELEVHLRQAKETGIGYEEFYWN